MSFKLATIRLLDTLNRMRKRLLAALDAIGIFVALIGFVVFVFHIGFPHTPGQVTHIHLFFNIVLLLIFISNLAGAFLVKWEILLRKLRLAELLTLPVILLLLDARIRFSGIHWYDTIFMQALSQDTAMHAFLIFILILEISTGSLRFSNRNTNPALVFVFSFLVLILFGTALLLLPKATYEGIGFTDAFFTATSAVCVTGLIVVDTATYFTPLGHIFIIVLVQLGGLGIMTFTSFFGYFFKGSSSFGNEFLLKELLNEERMGEIFRTIGKIVLVTFTIEALGALFIYFSVNPQLFDGHLNRLSFSVFHAISAFCNAGFSLLTNNLAEFGFRYNYQFQFIIALLIIIGGLGFPIVFNYFSLIKSNIQRRFRSLYYGEPFHYVPHIINVSSKIVLLTTSLLIVGGTVLFFIFENNHSLQGLSLTGKIAGSFFGAVTPRTAGFNTLDMSALAPATLLLYFLLMWIGASPGSTGGGIKTTTFAVAVTNILNLGMGKDRVELYGREVSESSVKRAFAVIVLSVLVLGSALLLLELTDGALSMRKLAFEVFSAFGTVGLSLGITSQLSFSGKWIIILTMFLGRVGTFTIMVAFFRKVRSLNYRYPFENVMIN